MSGWYEREEISRVTLDWLKSNFRPTAREMELLEIIRDRKLVKRSHLEIISPSYRNSGEHRTRIINRAIKRLYQNMCIDKVGEKSELGKGNTPFIVALDRGGSILLGITHKKRIPHVSKLVKGQEYVFRKVPPITRHVNGVNQLEVDTILLCEENQYSIVEWDIEKGREFSFNSEKIAFIPDVTTTIRKRDKSISLYIEYDTGSEDRGRTERYPVIKSKIDKYKKYYFSELWKDKHSCFPIILFVTEDDKRIPYFNNKCREMGITGIGIYSENYRKVLEHLVKSL